MLRIIQLIFVAIAVLFCILLITNKHRFLTYPRGGVDPINVGLLVIVTQCFSLLNRKLGLIFATFGCVVITGGTILYSLANGDFRMFVMLLQWPLAISVLCSTVAIYIDFFTHKQKENKKPGGRTSKSKVS